MPPRRTDLSIELSAGVPRRLSAASLESDGEGGIPTPPSSGGKIPSAGRRWSSRLSKRQSPYAPYPPQLSVGLSGPMQGMGLRGGRFAQVAKKPAHLKPINSARDHQTPRQSGSQQAPPVPASMPASGRRQSRLPRVGAKGAVADAAAADATNIAALDESDKGADNKSKTKRKADSVRWPPPPPPPSMIPQGWLLAPVTELGAAAAAASAREREGGDVGGVRDTYGVRDVGGDVGGSKSPPKRKRLSLEAREERRARKVAADAAASREAAAAEQAEHEAMVAALREYDQENIIAPPSPITELSNLAEEAGDPALCKELRARLRASIQQVLAEQRSRPSSSSDAPVPPSRPPSHHPTPRPSRLTSPLSASRSGSSGAGEMEAVVADPMVWLRSTSRGLNVADFRALLVRLRQKAEEGTATAGEGALDSSTDSTTGAAEWVAERVFSSLDRTGAGELTPELVVRGLFPAFSRDRRLRLRWLWERVWDPSRKGFLSAVDIFFILEQMPEGSRLEEDLLAMIKAAAAKRESGQAVRIECDEYVAGLSGNRIDEADPLGLRRRRRQGDAARMLRARARSMLLAQQWAAGVKATTENDPMQQPGLDAHAGRPRRMSMQAVAQTVARDSAL